MTLFEPSWDDARNHAWSLASFIGSETVPISKALNRILAKDAISKVDLPTYETSAMDGYAVSGNGPWEIIGEVKAGTQFSGNLNSGEAVEIATGAVIPGGTFGILRWEDASTDGKILDGSTTKHKDFRPSGAEAHLGETLIKAGTSLNPGMLGLLAAAGFDEINVVKKPRVTLILLGDEIQLKGVPRDGLVRDSLGPQLPFWLEKLGCEVVMVEYISDQLQLTIDAISRARIQSEIIVTTGGTADGPRDFLHLAIEHLHGLIHIDKVAVRPGHPQLLAEIAGVPLLGLPGNPQSAVVALLTLGQPLIDAMLGKCISELPLITSDDSLISPSNFSRLILGSLEDGKFRMGEYLGSAMLRSLAYADGFAVCTDPPTPYRWLELPL